MNRILIAASIAFAMPVGWAQQQYTITGSSVSIRSARPMSVAAEIARERFGVPVSYEDPKTLFPSDVVDETAEAVRQRNPNVRALGQKRENLELQLPAERGEGRPKREQALQFLRAAVREQISRGNNGDFEILENKFGLVMVPKSARGRSGKLEIQPSPLETRITITPVHLNAEECLKAIVEAVSAASGEKVTIGLLPSNYVVQTAGTCEASNEPARDAVLRAIYFPRIISMSSPGVPEPPRPAFVWHLLYGISGNEYVLSVTPAVQLRRSRFGGYESTEILVKP